VRVLLKRGDGSITVTPAFGASRTKPETTDSLELPKELEGVCVDGSGGRVSSSLMGVMRVAPRAELAWGLRAPR
jgi:hypothetical protein